MFASSETGIASMADSDEFVGFWGCVGDISFLDRKTIKPAAVMGVTPDRGMYSICGTTNHGTALNGVAVADDGVALRTQGRLQLSTMEGGVVPAGRDQVTLPCNEIGPTSHAVVTTHGDPNGAYWVELDTKAKTFTVHLSKKDEVGVAVQHLHRRFARLEPGREGADDGAVHEMQGDRHHDGRLAVVVEEEARRLEQRHLLRVRPRRAHARVHRREQDAHERAAGEERVHPAEREAEEPPRLTDGTEHEPVQQREQHAVPEVHRVADHVGAPAVRRERCAEQKWEVHPRPAELLRGAQAARQDDRADETARDRAEDHRARPVIVAAALTKPRWQSACGKFPRSSPPGPTSSL